MLRFVFAVLAHLSNLFLQRPVMNTGVLDMRQGQIYDLTNRHNLAIAKYEAAILFAPQADAAKECRRYISSPYKRE